MKKISFLEFEASAAVLDGNLFKQVIISKARECISANFWISDAIDRHLKSESAHPNAAIYSNDLSIAVMDADNPMRENILREHEREVNDAQQIFDTELRRLNTQRDLLLRSSTKYWGWIFYASIAGFFHYAFWILAAALSILTWIKSRKYDSAVEKCLDLLCRFDEDMSQRGQHFRDQIQRIDCDQRHALAWSDNFYKSIVNGTSSIADHTNKQE